MHSVQLQYFGVELFGIRAVNVYTESMLVVSVMWGACSPVKDCESGTTANTDGDTPLDCRPETKPDWIDVVVAT